MSGNHDHRLSVPSGAGGEEYRDQDRFGRHLAERVIAHISGTGENENDNKAVHDLPSDRYFAGSLVPSAQSEYSGLSSDLQEKLSPSAIQAEFLVDPDRVDSISVLVSAHVYYRSFPTYEEQNEERHVELGSDDSNGDSGDSSDELAEFKPVYRRLRFESSEIDVSVPSRDEFRERDVATATSDEAVVEAMVEGLGRRIRELDESESQPSVWRAAADLALPRPLGGLDHVESGSELTHDDYSGNFQFPTEIVEEEDSFDELVAEISSRAEPLVPSWDIEISCEFAQESDGLLRGTLTVENTSEPLADTSGYDTRFGADSYDTTLFDVQADLEARGGIFEDFTFERLEEDFRYDRALPGHGTNCVVERVNDSRLRTEYLPTHRQQRYETRDPEDLGLDVDTTFETMSDLRGGGLAALDGIAEGMRQFHDEWYQDVLEDHYLPRDDFREDDERDFERDREAFEREIKRFERGVECLREDLEGQSGSVARSFELMNETFYEKVREPDGSFEYESWYLFQIIFIVRVIPDLASREPNYSEWSEVTWRDEEGVLGTEGEGENFDGREMEALDLVDILWFPTGGGKTEAYLGLALFSAFFDRKRGKNYGVTAWTRFPLRLLSLQQTQRVGELLMHAEMHRLSEPDISGDGFMPFTLGYLVGSKNTPNKLSSYVSDNFADDDDYLREFLRYRDSDEAEDQRREVKVFPSCPVCGASTGIRATDDLRLAHYCTADTESCEWQQRTRPGGDEYQIFDSDELPVHIVDNELYRYAPTVIVGTIDKICAVGYERKSAHLYAGKMDSWCPDHGFASFEECTEKYGCHERYGGQNGDDHLVRLEQTPLGRSYDSPPSLQIQDEMHLLEESLGTFDSHFETFVDTYQRFNGHSRTKIIGATATIEDYDKQAEQLYLRKAERFPVEGPKLGENFYATTKEATQRHFVGVMPHGITHINAVIQLVYHYTREIESLRKSINEGSGPHPLISKLNFEAVQSNDDLLELIELYETNLAYTISKRDKNRFTNSIQGQIAGYLRSDGLPEPRLEELTGDTRFDDVEDVLDNLENPPSDSEDRYNVIAATNMISHGVDVPRFNYMVFFGMPRETAEYIQSSSRAGRRHPGLLLVCFNPSRERDQSHYHLFGKYHEFLDRLVEPVPVNRWSNFSAKRTVPSLLFGWMLSQWLYETGERLYFPDQASQLVRTIQAGEAEAEYGLTINDIDDLQSLMERSYGSDLYGDLPEAFEGKVHQELDRALTNLENIQTDMASEALNPNPMMSLRDIDKPIPFKPHGEDNLRVFNTLSRR